MNYINFYLEIFSYGPDIDRKPLCIPPTPHLANLIILTVSIKMIKL